MSRRHLGPFPRHLVDAARQLADGGVQEEIGGEQVDALLLVDEFAHLQRGAEGDERQAKYDAAESSARNQWSCAGFACWVRLDTTLIRCEQTYTGRCNHIVSGLAKQHSDRPAFPSR